MNNVKSPSTQNHLAFGIVLVMVVRVLGRYVACSGLRRDHLKKFKCLQVHMFASVSPQTLDCKP